jgi:uncharacterized membrane protein
MSYQSNKKSIVEAIIQTFVGTITGFFLTMIIFPLFGVYTDVATIAGITIAFMVVGIVKNYLIRRFFNYLHKTYFIGKQKRHQSLFESGFQTIVGTVLSFYLSIIIYPYFGLEIPTLTIGGITIAFTIASIIKNYFVRRYFVNN